MVVYFLGYLVGHKNISFEKNFKPKIINLDIGKPRDVDFSIFWDAYKLITEKYVSNYSAKDMVYGAIKGMVESLNDPYSMFMRPDQTKMLQQDLSGEIEGIGAEITKKDDKLVIVAPLVGSPAEKAGLKSNDEIIEIDNESTKDLTLDQAISKIRGKAGTEVELLIKRGNENPKTYKIRREKIVIKSVTYEIKDKVGYIKITQFGDDTADLAKQAAEDIAKTNPRAIILDLRDNPGGYLNKSIDVASLFMKRGVVTKQQYRDGRTEDLNTTLASVLENVKIIVLINEGSASASEIVAGALRDSRNALIIGKKSFGKGSVQELEELKDGSTLRITIAKWLTPKGYSIDKEGIKPDIEVDLSDEDVSNNRDPQLERAYQEAQ